VTDSDETDSDETDSDERDGPALPAPLTATHASQLEHLVEEIGSRASATVVYGEPVTAEGITVIPVAEVAIGFGFGGATGRGAGAAKTGEGGGGGGGVRAKPRGFIEIKDGTATYKPVRSPWLDVAIPLAALVAGAALPGLARRFRGRS
jgi:hypothetical protein